MRFFNSNDPLESVRQLINQKSYAMAKAALTLAQTTHRLDAEKVAELNQFLAEKIKMPFLQEVMFEIKDSSSSRAVLN